MPDPLKVSPGGRIPALAFGEQPLLLHQRGDVPDRIADRQNEPGIRKGPEQIVEARHVVVAFGHVPAAIPDRQQFADVIAIEGLEFRVSGCRAVE